MNEETREEAIARVRRLRAEHDFRVGHARRYEAALDEYYLWFNRFSSWTGWAMMPFFVAPLILQLAIVIDDRWRVPIWVEWTFGVVMSSVLVASVVAFFYVARLTEMRTGDAWKHVLAVQAETGDDE